MNDIKVRLSLCIQGAQMLSKQECLKNPKDSYDYFRMTVNRSSKGKQKETITVATRKSRTVKQNISISKEAYNYMIDSKTYPDPKLKRVWGNYSIHQRLKYHCGQIAQALGASDFTFEVLED